MFWGINRMKTHILLLDENMETRSRINFLLKIAGHTVTEFPDREEAVNWIINARQSRQNFDLLLINYLDTNSRISLLIDQIHSFSRQIPILQLNRPSMKNYATVQTELFKGKYGFFICNPEVMIQTIHAVVNNYAHQ